MLPQVTPRTPPHSRLRELVPSLKHGTADEWRAIARGPDVLYYILRWEGKRHAWTERDFYESGVQDWSDFRSHWSHYWPELGGTCLEIGCGPGRLTAPLLRDFERVIALDVSPDLIERARRVAPDAEFHQVDGTRVPLPDDCVDAVMSVNVLQHLDELDQVEDYLRDAARVLRPGGAVMIHLPLRSLPPTLRCRLWREGRLLVNRWRLARGREQEHIRMRLYRLEQVDGLLESLGFENVELRMLAVRSNGERYHFWFARAPGSARLADEQAPNVPKASEVG